MADLVWSDPDPDKEEFAISPRLVLVLSLLPLRSLTSPTPSTAEQATPSAPKS